MLTNAPSVTGREGIDQKVASPLPRPIAWYRSPLAKQDFKTLHEKSDLRGWAQAGSHLALILSTGSLAFYSFARWPVVVTLLLVFLHGTVCTFVVNGVHELGHGTVFKTKSLNALFLRIYSFLYWMNFELFNASHARHHRYTLHAPDDLEVVLPLEVLVKHFFQQGFINPRAMYVSVKDTIRIALGHFRGDWELVLYPEGSSERTAPIRWARIVLAGHLFILCVSLYFHMWLLPVLTSLIPLYGSWLFFLCNNTQHIGLQDDVPDFRLCCRTFTLNPFVEFLYWHMNFHIEHHMYAAVPCYNLAQLHNLIQHDLPPCPHGLIATWQEIAEIQRKQKDNPTYQHVAPLPSRLDASTLGVAE